MKNIIFIAPHAAGKGTISEMIENRFNLPHISIGDLLRDEIAHMTKLGLEVKDIMARGDFVPDEVIAKLLKKRLSSKDVKKGYILDGYPGNLSQAKDYDKLLEELSFDMGKVIYLNIDKETALKRTMSRVICPKCGATYNTSTPDLSPVREGICDNCDSKLVVRSDDNEETFKVRFDNYMKETYPLIDYYKNKNNLIEIDASKSPNEIFEEIKKVIK